MWAASGYRQGGFVHREKGYALWSRGSQLALNRTTGVFGYPTGWYLHGRDLPGWALGLPSVQFNSQGWSVRTPFWMLCLIAALPTAFLWVRDRRPPPGHCQRCGYDLIAPGEAWERGMRCSS
jgi:hypothetical protein